MDTLLLHGFGLSCVRRECNDDRCLSRKCNKYAFCVNGLVSVHLLHIDVLFNLQYCECAAPHRVGSTGQAKKKALKCNDTSSSNLVCQAA